MREKRLPSFYSKRRRSEKEQNVYDDTARSRGATKLERVSRGKDVIKHKNEFRRRGGHTVRVFRDGTKEVGGASQNTVVLVGVGGERRAVTT